MAAAAETREALRLESLRRYRILDTEPERAFDDLTYLAAHICGVPIALVSLVDADRQWFKSKVGVDVDETPREIAFCAHAIQQSETFVVPDATTDARFRSNPLVTSDPYVRFYAGVPVMSREGEALGTLCVIDRVPRELSKEQRLALAALTRQVQAQMELRRNLLDLKEALRARDEAEAAREALVENLQEQLENVKRLSALLPMSSNCKFDMTAPAEVGSIDKIVSGVMSLTAHMRSAEGKEFEVEMALREALANAIKHGCKNDATKQIQCSVACDQDGDLLVVIRDPGQGFCIASVPDPREDENVYRSHGRGLFLINQFMDDVEFTMRRSGGGGSGTEVRFRASKRSE